LDDVAGSIRQSASYEYDVAPSNIRQPASYDVAGYICHSPWRAEHAEEMRLRDWPGLLPELVSLVAIGVGWRDGYGERLARRGGAVQVDSIKTRVESAPGFSA
jgi:hypothetical protein